MEKCILQVSRGLFSYLNAVKYFHRKSGDTFNGEKEN